MRGAALLGLGLLAAGCAPGPVRPSPARLEAVRAWRRGDGAGALKGWRALAAAEPGRVDLAAGLAAVARQEGLADESLAARREAIRLDPGSRWHRHREARLLLERGDPEAALFALGDPGERTEAWEWMTRGQCERRLGRAEQALASFDRARAADPTLALAEQERAETLASVSRYVESASAYQAALALDGSAVHLKARAAVVEERLGQLASAYERWRQLALVDPSSTTAQAGKTRLARLQPGLAAAEQAREADRARAFDATPAPYVEPLPPTPLSPLLVGIVTDVTGFTAKFAYPCALGGTESGGAAAIVPADLPVAARLAAGRLLLTWSGGGAAAPLPVSFTASATAAGFALFNVHFEKGSYWSEQENRAYRGRLTVLERSGSLRLVNEVSVEEYLLSVVPSEMPYTWPSEALKAQAVAARAETLFKLRRHRTDGFDVCATQHCAVYRGIVGEKDATTAAVAATRGEVLLLPSGKPLDAIYAGNCGGWGSSDDAVWSDGEEPGVCDLGPDAAPLWAGMPWSPDERERFLFARPDGFCLDRGARAAYRWTRSYDEAELSAQLDRKFGVGAPATLRLKTFTPEGWVTGIEVAGPKGSKVVRRDAIRTALGTIRSDFFLIERLPGLGTVPPQILLVGAGWGHGAGMCQDGAYGLATRGRNYRAILAHYYPDATLKCLYE